MTRHLIHDKSVQAQQYQPESDPPSVSIKDLNSTISDPGNANQASRQRFGSAISMEGIQQALQSADRGAMRQLTDLSRETVDTDPHLASILQKRFGAASTLPWQVIPADGFGIDKERAMFYATLVREQLHNLQNFQQIINQLAWGLFDGRAALENKWGTVVTPVKSTFGAMTLVLLGIEWIHPRRINFGPSREMRITDETRGQAGGSFSVEGLSLDDEDLKSERLWRKFVSWTPQLFGEYPEREGLARRCLYWSFFKRFAARDMMILLELFGKPWRILEVTEESTASNEDLIAGDEAIEALGAAYSARIPRGTKVEVVQPGRTAGQVHQEVVTESDKQLSKLVLGQTGTTDGVPAGLNSSQASVMQDEQFMILVRDARALSQIIESQITDAIVELNFGPESLPLAPKFILRSDIPADRASELLRLDSALNAGLEISRDEAYEISGFRQPESDEAIIRIDQPSPLSPILPPPQPRPVIVYPKGESPETGEQQPPATIASEDEGADDSQKAQIGAADINKIVTVNEARAAEGLPPLTLPDGTLDPDGDLTVVEFAARNVGNQAGVVEDEPEPEVEEDDEDDETDEDEDEEAIAATRLTKIYALVKDEDMAQSLALSILSRQADIARMKDLTRGSCKYCLQVDEHKQPETPFGSPEEILKRGERVVFRASGKWANDIADATKGKTSASQIFKAINRAGEKLDINSYARPLERSTTQSVALGALDNALEIGDVESPNVNASKVQLAFSDSPFKKAIDFFKSKDVVTKSRWNEMTAELKKRSFTVAGTESQAMLNFAHSELATEIAAGADLRAFSAALMDRFREAGLAPSVAQKTLTASHVETVFRTNVLNSYGAGRHAHASQPEVVRRRPVWQIRVVSDNRIRDNHRRAANKMLLATDPFWTRAYPPFGFNCRCRAISKTSASLNNVVAGSTITFLPDQGFTSGQGVLL